jgi:hypothetical protein
MRRGKTAAPDEREQSVVVGAQYPLVLLFGVAIRLRLLAAVPTAV